MQALLPAATDSSEDFMQYVPTRRADLVGTLFNEVFNDFFTRPGTIVTRSNQAVARARLDVIEKGDKYQIVVDLPGVKKEDIQVQVEGAQVTITAETKTETEKKDGERVLYSERSATSYGRSFELPVEVTEEGAEARFDNGVLTLTLPKRQAVLAKRITVN
jgi:HSP20 family protein